MNVKLNGLRQKEFVSLSKQRGDKVDRRALMRARDLQGSERWTELPRIGFAGERKRHAYGIITTTSMGLLRSIRTRGRGESDDDQTEEVAAILDGGIR